MTREAKEALETMFNHINNSGHCDFDYEVHLRMSEQKDNNEYPNVEAGDLTGFGDWLRSKGYTEGSESGEAALHHLVRHDDDINGGGRSRGLCWPDYSAITYSMSTAAYPGKWNRFTVQHEVGHNMIDSGIDEVDEMTHSDVSECKHAGPDETIHNAEHTLGTVVDGGKTVMAHRSPTAAECTGGGNGSGVGDGNAAGAGISPGRTSHAADKAFGITKRNNL